MKDTHIGYLKIINANGTHFEEGSVLPLYIDESNTEFVVEEYEEGEPCEHTLYDLDDDGVVSERLPL